MKGELLKMNLHAAEGDELAVKGNTDIGERKSMHRNEELSKKENMGSWGQQERRHGICMVYGPRMGRFPMFYVKQEARPSAELGEG